MLAVVCASCAGIVLSAGSLQTPSQTPPPAFRSRSELVLLPVTARDVQGRVVRDLVEADFRIFENGRPQRIAMFSGDHIPTAVSLLVDTSASMQPNLAATQVAADAIVDRLGPADVGQVVAFNSTVDVRQDFTSDHALLRRAIDSTRADGSTALYNAVYIALRALQHQRPSNSEIRREAIILLSDGEDTVSLLDFDRVLDAARRSQTLIYTIDLQIGPGTPQQMRGKDSAYVLRQLAEQTGGRTYAVTDVHQLDNVYKEIYDAIAASYMLGYVPLPDAPGGDWRSISISVTRPGVVARTRAGYFRQ
jgi:Ca-activated chloride channel family protein